MLPFGRELASLGSGVLPFGRELASLGSVYRIPFYRFAPIQSRSLCARFRLPDTGYRLPDTVLPFTGFPDCLNKWLHMIEEQPVSFAEVIETGFS